MEAPVGERISEEYSDVNNYLYIMDEQVVKGYSSETIIIDINNMILDGSKNSKEALKLINQALTKCTDKNLIKQLILLEGYIYYLNGDKKKAYSFYKKKSIEHNEFVELIVNLGNIADENGKYDKAISQYDKALKIDSKFYSAHVNKAISLWHQDKNNYAKSILELNKAIEINPNCKQAYLNLANILAYKGNFDEAIEKYKKALTVDPQYWRAHYYMGKVLLYAKINNIKLKNNINLRPMEIIANLEKSCKIKVKNKYNYDAPEKPVELKDDCVSTIIDYINRLNDLSIEITHLDLSNSGIKGKNISSIASSLILSSLDLSDNKLTDSKISHLVSSDTITWLNLANNKIKNDGIKMFIDNKVLLWINIDKNKIDSIHYILLQEALKRNRDNAKKYIYACKEGSINIASQMLKEKLVSPYVIDSESKLMGLEIALINHNWELANSIIKGLLQNYHPHHRIFNYCMKTLERLPYLGLILDLSACKLNSTHITKICNILSKSQTIEEINISENNIDNSGLQILVDKLSIHNSLKQINIERNLIKGDQATLDCLNKIFNSKGSMLRVNISSNFIESYQITKCEKRLNIEGYHYFQKCFDNPDKDNQLKRYGFFYSTKNFATSLLAQNEAIKLSRDRWVVARAYKKQFERDKFYGSHAMLFIEGIHANGQVFLLLIHLTSTSVYGNTATLEIKQYDPVRFSRDYNLYKLNYAVVEKDIVKEFFIKISEINQDEILYSSVPLKKEAVNCRTILNEKLLEVGITIDNSISVIELGIN